MKLLKKNKMLASKNKAVNNDSKFRLYVACIASTLAVIVLAITGFLNISSFQKNYINSLASSYSVIGSEARRTIEYSVKFHKPLENFSGMEEILVDIKNQLPAIDNVYVISLNGKTLYDINGPTNRTVLPEKLLNKILLAETQKNKAVQWILFDKQYHTFIPIRNANANSIAVIDIVISEEITSKEMYVYLYETLKMMALIAIGTILIVLTAIFKTPLYNSNGEFNKRALMIALTLILVLTQITYGIVNVINFRSAYLELTDKNLNVTSGIIQNKIEGVINLGFSYGELDGVDDWLKNLIIQIPEIDHINLRSDSQKILFTTTSLSNDESHNNQTVTRQLSPDATNKIANLEIVVSKNHLNNQLIKLLLDIGTMVIISIFFLVEMLFFIIILMARRNQMAKKIMGMPITFHHENSVRALSFILLLSSYMSISFIPLLMNDIYQPILGLPKSVSIGLPIASEMFGAFVSSLIAGYFIDKHGWRPVFLTGLICMVAFTATSAISEDPTHFILIRCLVGLGYGAAWMGLRGLVAIYKDKEERSRGFSILNAGIFSGQNCAAVIGGLLADRIGFSGVFVIASFLGLFAIPICFKFSINAKPANSGESAASLKKITEFFCTKNNFVFLFLMTIPTAIAGTFLNYYFPLFSRSIDISQSDIGRGFLLYGICIVFIGPLLIKKLKAYTSEKQIILISGLAGVTALLTFWYEPTFTGALIAIMILGVADSIGLTSQNSHFMNLPSTTKLGYGKALSLYSAIKKVGQLTGPAIYGVAIVAGGIGGIGAIGVSYLLCIIGFVALSRK